MGGVRQGYAVGLHINPERAGELMAATGERPPGINGRVHHSIDAGRNCTEIGDPNLPARYVRVPVVFFAEGAAWIAMDTGRVLRADEATGSWFPLAQLPCEINAAAAGGSPSSIRSGYMP